MSRPLFFLTRLFRPAPSVLVPALCLSGGMTVLAAASAPQPQPNPSGTALTKLTGNRIKRSNPFFAKLGINDRTCESCHREAAGWSITPAQVRSLFDSTEGLDPLFRTNDGTTSPQADVSTLEARQAAYAPLLERGLIRVGLPIPAGAEFALDAVDDPHGFASVAELSLFRRPLPATNLRFETTVMWDGRKSTPGQTHARNLADQALDATRGHAQAAVAPTPAQLQSIVRFESSLHHAQIRDAAAGLLTAEGGKGGPAALRQQEFTAGLNNPFSRRFNPITFTLFSKWAKARGGGNTAIAAARKSVARGEVSFNRKRFTLTGVAGFNDRVGQPAVTVTCSSCHHTPNVGSSSIGLLTDIGVSAPTRRLPHQPLYTLRNLGTNAVRQTTDPGRALITGKWADLDRFKTPGLRGLASRAPYFHDGSAATLGDVIDFYDTRFDIRYSAQERADLEAFMRAL